MHVTSVLVLSLRNNNKNSTKNNNFSCVYLSYSQDMPAMLHRKATIGYHSRVMLSNNICHAELLPDIAISSSQSFTLCSG